MQRAFILLWTATAIVVIALMVLLYVSLIPHFQEIGDAMIWVIRIVLACGTALMLVFTWVLINIMLSRMRRERNHERLIVAGEVALYLQAGGDIYHASKEHNMGLIAPPNTVTIEEESPVTDETILDLWQKGLSLRTIEKATGAKYNRIQKVTSEEKQKLEKQLNR